MKKSTIFLILTAFTACSLDYSDSGIIENISEEIPNTIAVNYSSVEIKNGSPVLEVNAEKAEMYNSLEETKLTDLTFFNYKNNEISNSGKSDSAVLMMKSGDARLSGDIEIKSLDDNSYILAESLYWNNELKTLNSLAEDSVTVADKNGSIIHGAGFSANLRKKVVIFEDGIEGVFENDED